MENLSNPGWAGPGLKTQLFIIDLCKKRNQNKRAHVWRRGVSEILLSGSLSVYGRRARKVKVCMRLCMYVCVLYACVCV